MQKNFDWPITLSHGRLNPSESFLRVIEEDLLPTSIQSTIPPFAKEDSTPRPRGSMKYDACKLVGPRSQT